jgi:hypothetical protein
MHNQAPPSPWRCRFRISVRAFIVLVLLTGAGLGWLVHSARVQRDVVAAISKAHGRVYYQWQYKEGVSSYYWEGEPWAPRWLVDHLGVDYFGHVVAVDHGGWVNHAGTFSDADMVPVGHLTGLVELWLLASSVTNAGLAHLNKLTHLENVHLYGSEVSDAGLIHLRGLSRLKKLCLAQSRVTDAGLVHLEGLTNLRELDLSSTRVSDAGLVHLRGLANLQTLKLSSTRVTDAELEHLKGLSRLRSLDLEDAPCTEAGARGLQGAIPGLSITH